MRGFYFDLAAHAPGPLVRTQQELADAITAHDPSRYAERYAQWRARFNARDDGHAAERVVARILDRGYITR
ncbi:CDP-glycerol glycerophosphotransferase family protein [Microbacterium elymi]|uniref:CDP-glycerol glycerophosphotransferase family protein n=1 Tax=Microbacterium elymi TaxID=2909587 RepID=UPI00338F9B7A